jgi:secreted Zn-dependent insulinase-like peptidase
MKKFTSPEDIPNILKQKYVAEVFDKERIQEFTSLVANPDNCLIFLTSKKF